CYLQRIGYMEQPAFTKNSYRGRIGLNKQRKIFIFFRSIAGPAGASESYDLGVIEANISYQIKKLHITQIGSGPAAFDMVNDQLVKLLSNLDLVFCGRGFIFDLCSVAYGSIEYFNCLWHYSASSTASPSSSSSQFNIERSCLPTFSILWSPRLLRSSLSLG